MLNRYADEEFIKENPDKIKGFTDLNEKHWGYYNIIEATNGHEYIRDKNDNDEKWQELNNKSLID